MTSPPLCGRSEELSLENAGWGGGRQVGVGGKAGRCLLPIPPSASPDLSPHQRAPFPVAADEVCHWGGHDEKGPWRRLQPTGKERAQGLRVT